MATAEPSELAAVPVFYRQGQFAEAEQLCQKVLAQHPERVDVLSWLGLLAERQGRLEEGVRYYQQVLERKPETAEIRSNLASLLSRLGQSEAAIAQQKIALQQLGNRPDAHYNLAVILAEAGHLEAAIQHYQTSLTLDPENINAYNNLGTLLGQQGKLLEALAYYQRAVAIAPHHFNAQNNLAVTLAKLNRLEEAIPHFEQALALQPSALAHHHLGQIYQRQGQPEAAARQFEQAIARQPDYFSAYLNLGIVLQRRGKLKEALACYHKALELKPDSAATYDNIGTVLHEQKRLAEAIAHYEKAIELNPKDANAYSNLGTARLEQGDLEGAIATCQQAIHLKPDHVDAHNNLASAYLELGQFEAAITEFETALQLQPDHANAHLNLGIALLLLGNYERGWQEYHWRWQTRQCPDLRYPQALWDGSDLQKQWILLTAEQGLGDTIQFARYAALVQQRGGRVVLACQKSLFRLFSSLPGVERCVDRDRTDVPTQYHAPLLDLPMLLGTRVETIPAPIPYLAALPDPSVQLQTFANTRLKVGFVWSTNPQSSTAGKRSAPLAYFLRLLELPEIALYSLQKERSDTERLALGEQDRLQDLSDQLGDFADTAAAIAQLDLVISVDTSVIHLAGAMGKPVWTLLAFVADWRWLWNREDTPWYPTMRLFRQTQPGDWAGVFERVQASLQQELINPNPLERYRLATPVVPLDPVQIYLRLGYSYYCQGQPEPAIACYEKALRRCPDSALLHNNLGAALCQQGKVEQAIGHYRQAIDLQAEYADAHLNLGLALLLQGHFTQGFKEYFWRWRTSGYTLPYPETLWDGTELRGKTILLTAEQGYGDTIQFIRYAPLIAAMGGNVIVACQQPLLRLLATVPGVSRCLDQDQDAAQVHVHAPLLELPRLLGTTLETIPDQVPYLGAIANDALIQAIGDRVQAASAESASPRPLLKVGVVWASHSTSATAQSRSCTLLDLAPLFALKEICWFSLQYRPSAAEQAELAQLGIENLQTYLGDFADTACAITQMDLILTVDTAVAHLAGALGKPTWVLLPFAPDWRWLLNRNDSPWYPTMRLFRQDAAGAWQGVVETIRLALQEWSAALSDGQPALIKTTSQLVPVSSATSYPADQKAGSPRLPALPASQFNQLIVGRHGVFLYNQHDIYIGRSLALYGEWSEAEIDLFRQLLRPGDRVVEVGANIGTHTVFLAKAVTATGQVLAYEPQRIVFQTLCANVALNSLTNVHCYPIGLGATSGFAQIPPLDYNQANNFGGVSLQTQETGETVQIAPLDSFNLPTCRLLKIDAEGMELDVLQGATATITRCQPILYIENDRPEKAPALIHQIQTLGYQLYWHRPPLFNPENFCQNPTNVFGQITSLNMLGILPTHGIALASLARFSLKPIPGSPLFPLPHVSRQE